MIKEIFEQPITTKTCLKEYIDNNVGCIDDNKPWCNEINEDDLDSVDFDLI